MRVRVEVCWGGGDSMQARLTFAKGARLVLPLLDGKWNRRAASRALDLIEVERGVPRARVRFEVR